MQMQSLKQCKNLNILVHKAVLKIRIDEWREIRTAKNMRTRSVQDSVHVLYYGTFYNYTLNNKF